MLRREAGRSVTDDRGGEGSEACGKMDLGIAL